MRFGQNGAILRNSRRISDSLGSLGLWGLLDEDGSGGDRDESKRGA